MPNWCQNEVDIEIDPGFEDLLKTIESYFSSPSPFQAILPMPSLLLNTGSGSLSFDVEGTPVTHRNWYERRSPLGRVLEQRPFSKEELAELSAIGHLDWYGWRCQHWGTKWEIGPQENLPPDEDRCLRYEFDTAWGPPTGICSRLREMLGNNGTITWFFREDGCQLAGWI